MIVVEKRRCQGKSFAVSALGLPFAAAQIRPSGYCVVKDGRPLLTLKSDGTVDADLQDVSEAAKLFVDQVRALWEQHCPGRPE